MEKPPKPQIPEKNELPLNIRSQEHLATSGESDVWHVDAQDRHDAERHIALKQNHREVFASDEEMQNGKAFYEFLKAFPGFGKFVPNTLYFKARMTSKDAPQAFAIQSLLKGRTLDQIPDEELYRDPEVVQQLIEFAHAAVDILQQTRQEGTFKPDFGTAATASEEAWRQGNRFGNSRFTTNVLVSDEPDEQGRRVFFVDTGVRAEERLSKTQEILERQIMGRARKFNFNRWIKKLERINAERSEP